MRPPASSVRVDDDRSGVGVTSDGEAHTPGFEGPRLGPRCDPEQFAYGYVTHVKTEPAPFSIGTALHQSDGRDGEAGSVATTADGVLGSLCGPSSRLNRLYER